MNVTTPDHRMMTAGCALLLVASCVAMLTATEQRTLTGT